MFKSNQYDGGPAGGDSDGDGRDGNALGRREWVDDRIDPNVALRGG